MIRAALAEHGDRCSQSPAAMFGNFNLNAGLSQLQDLGGRFQKIKEDLEQNIESSLRTNIAPSASGDEAGGVNASADGVVAFGGDQLLIPGMLTLQSSALSLPAICSAISASCKAVTVPHC